MAHPKTRRVQRGVIVDEHWIHEWCAFGYTEIDACLERHAAFDAYLTQQEDTMHRTDPPAPAPQPNPPTPSPGPAPAPQPNPR